MSSKLFAVLAVLMLVSQAMCGGRPGIFETNESNCDPADENSCLEGYVCVHIENCHSNPPGPDVCHPQDKCVPKVPLSPPDHHIG